MIYRKFYSELGKLVYAVTVMDGTAGVIDKKRLMDSAMEILTPLEKHKDAFGENVISYVLAEFDFLEEQSADPYACFDSFLDYMEQHFTGADETMLKVMRLVYATVSRVTDKVNNKGRKLLKRFAVLLQKFHAKPYKMRMQSLSGKVGRKMPVSVSRKISRRLRIQ
jgi:hypothetical protein